MDTALSNVDKNSKTIKINHKKNREPNKSFHQLMKKDQNLHNKNIHSNKSSEKPFANNSIFSKNQSLQTTENDHRNKEIHLFLTKQV